MKSCLVTFGTLILLLSHATVEAGFITNSSFETVSSGTGQGLLPTGWDAVTISPDTYSNDGSFGLPPSELGNFTGVTAFDGIRWVAGASFGRLASSTAIGGESFGTTLAMTLMPNQSYSFEASLFQAKRADLDNPGGYHLFLATENTSAGLSGAHLLGALAPTTGVDAWESRTLVFNAPVDAGSRQFLIFAPYQASGGNSYSGIDALSLSANVSPVPEPSSAVSFLLGAGILVTVVVRRSRKSPPLVVCAN